MTHQNGFLAFLALFLIAFSFEACRCVTCDDDPTTEVVPWSETSLETTGRIIALHSTADELFVFTPIEFYRVNPEVDGKELRVIEQRRFDVSLRTLGQPAINDLVFARASLDVTTNEELVEFQLAQSSGSVQQFAVDSLLPQFVALEYKGSSIGAFSRDGRIYVQPVILRNTRNLALMFFTLNYNTSFTRFLSIDFSGLVEIPGVLEEDQVVSSIRYIDNAFYLGTKRGGYKISESGVVETVIQNSTWVRDFFKYNNEYYASQIGVSSLLKSSNGTDFIATNTSVQDMDLVDVLGDVLVTQVQEGWPYNITFDIMEQVKPLKLNRDFPDDKDLYFGIDELDGFYYLGLDRKIWLTDELKSSE